MYVDMLYIRACECMPNHRYMRAVHLISKLGHWLIKSYGIRIWWMTNSLLLLLQLSLIFILFMPAILTDGLDWYKDNSCVFSDKCGATKVKRKPFRSLDFT